MRDPQISIEIQDDQYRADVQFLAVQIFDEATNKILNLTKAEKYVLLALASHLNVGTNQILRVSGIQQTGSRQEGLICFLQMLVPIDGVQIESRDVVPPQCQSDLKALDAIGKAPTVLLTRDLSSVSSLLTRKADYMDTAEQIVVHIRESLSDLQGTHHAFYESIVTLEENGLCQFKTLRDAAIRDKLLLSLERQEILVALDALRRDTFDLLRQHVQIFGISALP